MELIAISPFVEDNPDFRRVLWTGEHTQLVAMTLQPGEDIGTEVHRENDQILSFLKGSGEAILDGKKLAVAPGDVLMVPAGAEHNITNTGPEPLLLYTIYGPPDHAPDTVHRTKQDAEAAEAAGKDQPPQQSG
jgi:mannose-6-phosphate isomerase-like protein (cupin superfamily)